MKIVNVSTTAQDTEIKLNGAKAASTATAIVLTSGHPEDENSLDEPAKVAPVTSQVTCSGSTLRHGFPPNSVTVLRLPLR